MTTSQARPGAQQPPQVQAAARPPWMEKPNAAVRAAKAVALLVVLLVIVPVLVDRGHLLADQQRSSLAGGLVLWPDQLTLDAYRTFSAAESSRAR